MKGYHAPVQFSTTAQLQLQLRLICCKFHLELYDAGCLTLVCLFGTNTDHHLDAMVTSIQRQYPHCGYRMMQGYLNGLNHRVQQGRVREAMARTDPEGLASRWCNTVIRRAYSVPSPNSIWHVDGNHRLIR